MRAHTLLVFAILALVSSSAWAEPTCKVCNDTFVDCIEKLNVTDFEAPLAACYRAVDSCAKQCFAGDACDEKRTARFVRGDFLMACKNVLKTSKCKGQTCSHAEWNLLSNACKEQVGYRSAPCGVVAPRDTAETVDNELAEACGEKVIDFEDVQGIMPVNGLPIKDQFEKSHGVVFESNAKLGLRTFNRLAGGAAAPPPKARYGKYWLSHQGPERIKDPSVLTIRMKKTSATVSGVVTAAPTNFSITVEALNTKGEVLDTRRFEKGSSERERHALMWSFRREKPEISTIRITGRRTNGKSMDFGLASFSPTCAPED